MTNDIINMNPLMLIPPCLSVISHISTCNLSSRRWPVLDMEACWEDEEDHCDVRSDASLLRLEVEGYMRPLSALSPGELPTWLHWGMGLPISITGNSTAQPVIKYFLANVNTQF